MDGEGVGRRWRRGGLFLIDMGKCPFGVPSSVKRSTWIPILSWSSYDRGKKQMRCEPSVQVKMRDQSLRMGACEGCEGTIALTDLHS